MKTGWKIAGGVIGSVLALGCMGVCGWYYYIYKYAPEKYVSNTYEVGMQTIKAGTEEEEQRYFCEVKYHANKNGEGFEMLDIKFNYMLDENQTAYYSQGLQYIAPQGQKIGWVFWKDATNVPTEPKADVRKTVSSDKYWNYWGAYKPFGETSALFNKGQFCEMFNYASGDDYKTVIQSTNPIGSQTKFKIQLGDDLYLMKFRNEDSTPDDANYIGREKGSSNYNFLWRVDNYYDYYAYYDYNFFCKMIYDGIQTLPYGTNSASVYEFGDIFNYYAFENGQFAEERLTETAKVKTDMKSYYAIKVEKTELGAQRASDSLFGAVRGSITFNMISSTTENPVEYFVGRSIFNVTEKDFDMVEIEAGYVVLKLKEDFVKTYGKLDTIKLKVHVNLDSYVVKNIRVMGFAKDCGLDKFEIYECKLLQTINGTLTEVSYA